MNAYETRRQMSLGEIDRELARMRRKLERRHYVHNLIAVGAMLAWIAVVVAVAWWVR